MSSWERRLWAAIGALTVLVSSWGLIDPSLYDRLIPETIRSGAVGQDAVSLVAGLALVAFGVGGAPLALRSRLIGLGLLGYLGYGYGIFVIERMYNVLYFGYLAIFAGAVWSVAVGCARLLAQSTGRATISVAARRTSMLATLVPPVVFVPLWTVVLLPLIRARDQIDSLYSIFILDLGFVMPAFGIVAVGLWRRRSWASLAGPVVLVLGSVLMVSLALSEALKPAYGLPVNLPTGLLPPLVLAALFTAAGVLHLRSLSLVPRPTPARTGLDVRTALVGRRP